MRAFALLATVTALGLAGTGVRAADVPTRAERFGVPSPGAVPSVASGSGGAQLLQFGVEGELAAPGCLTTTQEAFFGLHRADGRDVRLGRVRDWHVDGLTSATAAPVVAAGHEAVVLYRPNCGKETLFVEPLRRLRLLRAPFGRRPARPVVLSERAQPYPDVTRVATSARGDLAVAWLEPHSTRATLHLALGAMTGRFGRPAFLTRHGQVTDVRLAWTTDRELLVVYANLGRVWLRTYHPGGRFSRARALGPARRGSADLCVGPGGRAAIVASSVDYGDDASHEWSFRAYRRAGPRRGFAGGEPLESGRGYDRYAFAAERCAIAADGTTVFAWASFAVGHRLSVAVARTASEPLTAIVLAPTSDDLLLAIRTPEGVALGFHEPTGRRRAVLAPGAATFSAPEPAPAAFPLVDGTLPVDPRTGRTALD